MLFADSNANAVAYLVLRHLYDGDVIDWPLDEQHEHAPLFATLEQQGLIARWDRIWPLHDRYRLTEGGIAAIEAVYRPEGAEHVFETLRQRNLTPPQRRDHLQSLGLDPTLWPLLHDPTTHWTTLQVPGTPYRSYAGYVWEDVLPARRPRAREPVVATVDPRPRQYLVDLDRNDPLPLVSLTHDYDVS